MRWKKMRISNETFIELPRAEAKEQAQNNRFVVCVPHQKPCRLLFYRQLNDAMLAAPIMKIR
ncbi:hypothetical protein C2L65_21650 [Paraburkholderia terrae]|uniref:Uncharacterized protein n=2 Tax=Paraburkholderia terrae TaxID=311230 RepID=A0A2I8ERI8_9BURK|nr:hypothetical protein C2L65_21650 [Paraburkholderia terrae]